MAITSRHFKETEFHKCNPPCSMQDMKQGTMNRLDKARDNSGIPYVLNSAYRSKEHEKKQGRTGMSAHTLGYAVDIRCNTDANRYCIITGLLAAGFTRIGIAKTYIHADDSPNHTQCVIWMY